MSTNLSDARRSSDDSSIQAAHSPCIDSRRTRLTSDRQKPDATPEPALRREFVRQSGVSRGLRRSVDLPRRMRRSDSHPSVRLLVASKESLSAR